MKHFYHATWLCVVACFVCVSVSAQTTVETFNATGTYVIPLPGIIVGPDIDFSGDLQITSLDFTPGSVTFNGQPVDFDGTEASWLANTYNGSATIPALPGTMVDPSGPLSTAGPAGTMNGNQNITNLDLGPGFSASDFDLIVPSDFRAEDTTPSWNSPLVPELNGEPVTIITFNQIVDVIPNFTTGNAAAFVEVVIVGEIVAFEPIGTEAMTWSAIKATYRR